MSFLKVVSAIAKGAEQIANNVAEKQEAIRKKLEKKDDVELMVIEQNGSTMERAIARKILRERGM